MISLCRLKYHSLSLGLYLCRTRLYRVEIKSEEDVCSLGRAASRSGQLGHVNFGICCISWGLIEGTDSFGSLYVNACVICGIT